MAETPWRAQGPTGPGVGRHRSDVSDRRVEPPLCIQNAMLTKDKKPFTYTPGGIDLSEIRSPRMARRIERNANAPGVGEIPGTPPITTYEGPLPPAALAAMQGGLPVQVFPSGPPVPPPPPPMNIPPPPPMGPLPTKSVATTEGVFERPDMTKIIPENPMALLRKTPVTNRKSFAEEPDYQPIKSQDLKTMHNAQLQMQPRPQPKVEQYTQPQPYVEPQYMQPKPQYTQPKPQPQMVTQAQIITNSKPQSQPQATQPEIKTSTVQLGSLYIPPINKDQDFQRNVVSPTTPPQRNAQSPESPQSPVVNLNKAPRPWQNQKSPQELPQWAVRQEPSPPVQQQSPNTPQSTSNLTQKSPNFQIQQKAPNFQPQPAQQQSNIAQQQTRSPQPQSNVIGRVIIPVPLDVIPNQNDKNVEAVFITQPVVLQHPGGKPEVNQQAIQQRPVQSQQSINNQKVEPKGTRIIPIQIESAPVVQRQESKFSTPGTTPATPGSARSFNRQPSWTSTPTQSNAFKVIQKITNTDGEDDENEITTEHSPRNSQNFQQSPTEPIRKSKMSDGDRELMNKIKQAAARNEGGNRNPQVRTIPVQIEGESSGKQYIPPSEQTVQEPKKYTGSAIPSRSFKMLQAMTGDPCADENRKIENYQFHPICCRGFKPTYPSFPTPCCYNWHCHCSSHAISTNESKTNQNSNEAENELNRCGRHTPVPFCIRTYCCGHEDLESSPISTTPFCSNSKTTNTNVNLGKTTKTNFGIGPYKQHCIHQTNTEQCESINSETHPLPCWGYVPIYLIHCNLGKTEIEKNEQNITLPDNIESPSVCTSYPKCCRQCESNKSHVSKNDVIKIEDEEIDLDDSDSEAEDFEENNKRNFGALRAIRSVSDINIYDVETCYVDEESDEYNVSEATTTEENDPSTCEEDVIPHQLSVIFEESDRNECSKMGNDATEASIFTSDSSATITDIEVDHEDVLVKLSPGIGRIEGIKANIPELVVEDNSNVSSSLNIFEEDYTDREEIHEKVDTSSPLNESDDNDWWSIINKDEDYSPKQQVDISQLNEEQHNVDTNQVEKNVGDNLAKDSISKEENQFEEGSEEVDFWEIIGSNENENIKNVKKINVVDNHADGTEYDKILEKRNSEDEHDVVLNTTSTHDDTKNSDEQIKANVENQLHDVVELNFTNKFEEIDDESSTSSEESNNTDIQIEKTEINNESENHEEVKLPTIRERIEALHKASQAKSTKTKEHNETKINVKERITTLEDETSEKLKKCSIKIEEIEDDVDSGVTSDISRHISDNETEFPELRKMTKYQRAATHSRLYKLLQDECDKNGEEETPKNTECVATKRTLKEELMERVNEEMLIRRDSLVLPLKTYSDSQSVSSSGINSPGSPVLNERLVNELVQSLLTRKHGLIFKDLPMEKLKSAAVQILQEEFESTSSEEFNSFLSPLIGVSQESTPAQTPQEFYGNYSDFYETYNEAFEYDILPSKAFKLIQENKPIHRGFSPKCPRLSTVKDVSSPSPSPDTSLETNRATSAS